MAQIGIFVGMVYGNALLVAEEAEPVLQARGHEVTIFENPRLSDWQLYSDKVALIVTSTTGHGDIPDSIAGLYHDMKARLGRQPQLRYGVIALGDSSYENFCGGGKTFDAQLREQGATRVGDLLLVDAIASPEPESVTTPWVESWGKLL